ncbi:MAG: bifunctional UDP-4-keto-pentose/UDP-xylose synthase [Verrucomicrobiales bacterium]
MKILLLGAGGFIGVNLTERLLKDGSHDLVAVDIETDKLDEVAALDHPKLRYVHLDIRKDNETLELETKNADLVIDLVALANPALYVEDPLSVFHLNFTENLKIVEYCVKHKKRIIQFSTCEVYGMTAASVIGEDPKDMPCPFSEDETPLIMGPIKNHRWIYASAKQLLERVLHAYGLQQDFHYTIIRPFNFIGPRIDYLPSEKSGNPRVFSHFMNALLYGTPMKLVDGGSNYRAYTLIDDAVECMVRIIDNPDACDKQIINIGHPGNEVTIKELAHLMKKVFDEDFRVDGDPEPEIVDVSAEEFYGKGYEDCDRRIADISKAQNLLGWNPEFALREVVANTMEYFVKKHRAKDKAAPEAAETVTTA